MNRYDFMMLEEELKLKSKIFAQKQYCFMALPTDYKSPEHKVRMVESLFKWFVEEVEEGRVH